MKKIARLFYDRNIALALIMINILTGSASADSPLTWIGSLRGVAYALGWLMMILMGIKWIIADSANERAEAKKSMIYIVMGLLIVASACGLLQMYCDNAQKSFPPGALTCNPNNYCGTTTLP